MDTRPLEVKPSWPNADYWYIGTSAPISEGIFSDEQIYSRYFIALNEFADDVVL